jgi:hypothetical protein
MTSEDYEAIAQRLRFERETCQHWPKDMTRHEMLDHLAYALSDVLADCTYRAVISDDHARFDRDRFLTRAGSS